MSDTPKIHVVDFSEHGQAYDYCMTECNPGDYVELENGDVINLFQSWPVLLTEGNAPEILHRFSPEYAGERVELLAKYHAIKERNDPEDFVRAGDTPTMH